MNICPLALDAECDRYDGLEPSKICLGIRHKNCELYRIKIAKLEAAQRNIILNRLTRKLEMCTVGHA